MSRNGPGPGNFVRRAGSFQIVNQPFVATIHDATAIGGREEGISLSND